MRPTQSPSAKPWRRIPDHPLRPIRTLLSGENLQSLTMRQYGVVNLGWLCNLGD